MRKGPAIAGPLRYFLEELLHLFAESLHLLTIQHIGPLGIDGRGDACPEPNDR
ncbi:hypothetical protein ANABIO32_05160 [Rossellomorea marisflavi]|nr:hypothetical protein ANABIO32_05160 [Rossellomorea marisflavi]